MPQQKTMNQTLDDAMQPIPLLDFSGGLNSEADPADLPLNASPDCENVYFLPGRVVGRKGYIVKMTTLPAAADGIAFFYDTAGTRRLVVWSNGNLYDISNFTLTLVASGVYTAGKRIAWTTLNAKLYFSDGYTIGTSGGHQSGIRYYDPPTSLVTAPFLITSGTVGTIETPACKCLTTYAGSLLLGNLKYVDASTAPHTVLWSNVNDPTTMVGTNIFTLGQGQGGEINCLVPLGVSSVGVSPFQAVFVGKSQFGVYLLKGALSVSSLAETLLNCPAGVLDGATAKYVSGPEGSAFVCFLGTDRRVWYTNGIQTDELSAPIRTELFNYIQDRFTNVGSPQFTSAINLFNRHYVLDVGGNRQYCYDWMLKCWTRFNRWVSGYYIEAKDANTAAALYVADASGGNVIQQNAGTTDGGAPIAPYWSSPWLNGGDDDIAKLFMWLFLKYRTDTGQVTATATVNDGAGIVATSMFNPTTTQGNSAIWDSPGSKWDDPNTVWGGGSSVSFNVYKQKARFQVPVKNTDRYKILRGYNMQLKLSQSTPGYFEIMAAQVLYLPRGRRRVA